MESVKGNPATERKDKTVQIIYRASRILMDLPICIDFMNRHSSLYAA